MAHSDASVPETLWARPKHQFTAMYRAKMAGRAGYAIANVADWEIDKDSPRSTLSGLI